MESDASPDYENEQIVPNVSYTITQTKRKDVWYKDALLFW